MRSSTNDLGHPCGLETACPIITNIHSRSIFVRERTISRRAPDAPQGAGPAAAIVMVHARLAVDAAPGPVLPPGQPAPGQRNTARQHGRGHLVRGCSPARFPPSGCGGIGCGRLGCGKGGGCGGWLRRRVAATGELAAADLLCDLARQPSNARSSRAWLRWDRGLAPAIAAVAGGVNAGYDARVRFLGYDIDVS
jgi:hypothetical protein